MESPFEVLGLPPDADEDAVDDAYRRRVKEAHPDHGGSTEAFLLVQTAYEEIKSGHLGDDDGQRVDVDVADDGDEAAATVEDSVRVEYLNYRTVVDRGWSIDDDELFEKAAAADLEPPAWGRVSVDPDGYLLDAVEDEGLVWPFACRGGACANCAVAVAEGDLTQPVDHVLPEEYAERGIRLSCVGAPASDRLRVVYNVKELPGLRELRLPADRFEQMRADD